MSEQTTLHGEQYYKDLREFRDLALVESNYYGKRRKLGALVVGRAEAKWKSEQGGEALLDETGLRIGSMTIINLKPTTLNIATPFGRSYELITYRMDIDDNGSIDVYRTMLVGYSMRKILSVEAGRYRARQHGLDAATDEERLLLYAEMQRGASGMYK